MQLDDNTNSKRLPRREFLRQSTILTTTLPLVLNHARADEGASAGTTDENITFETVRFKTAQSERVVEGRVLIEAQDGGIILEGRDSRLWTIMPEDIVKREKIQEFKFKAYTPQQLGDRLKAELGHGFAFWEYGPLVICTNAGKNYADWCGSLFSRLHNTFEKFWRLDDLPLQEPEFPLPVCLFVNRREFSEYALIDADAATASSYGYYSLKSNRTAMFDISADEQGVVRSVADVNRRMEKSLSNVATMVHEATHQFAFNGGLHRRYADNPLWLMEGMAMFFEVPDLRSRTGWASVGQPNKPRLALFADWFKTGMRPTDSLQTLIRDDNRFIDPETAGLAYAEAWALTYYLIKRQRDDYTAYLKQISEKPMLEYLTAEERLAEFQKFFGDDWEQLDADMVSLLKRIRR